MCTGFGRDRHQLLIRQFYTVRQLTTVADYTERFEVIINHLSSYSHNIHPYFFLTRFVEGLRADIQAVVLVQRPPDLDTACSLALLQEEVVHGAFGDARSPSTSRPPDAQPRGGAPLPLPPPPTRPTPPAIATNRRGVEGAHADGARPGDTRADTAKVKALRDYRRARGLCFKCGERWGHDHVCPTSVQLHVVEELWELFGINAMVDGDDPAQPQDTQETVCAISRSALSGGVSGKAFQLRAWIQGHEVLMLVDSGSSTSFINQELAVRLEGVQPLPKACKVKVADGGELICSSMVHQCAWYTQGKEFATDMKILALGMYDAILRMDWLEAQSYDSRLASEAFAVSVSKRSSCPPGPRSNILNLLYYQQHSASGSLQAGCSVTHSSGVFSFTSPRAAATSPTTHSAVSGRIFRCVWRTTGSAAPSCM